MARNSEQGGWGLTEEMKASWYCRCSGAFKTLWRTLRAPVSAMVFC